MNQSTILQACPCFVVLSGLGRRRPCGENRATPRSPPQAAPRMPRIHVRSARDRWRGDPSGRGPTAEFRHQARRGARPGTFHSDGTGKAAHRGTAAADRRCRQLPPPWCHLDARSTPRQHEPRHHGRRRRYTSRRSTFQVATMRTSTLHRRPTRMLGTATTSA